MRMIILINSPATATGIAIVKAVSVLLLVKIAKAVAIILPSCILGGPAAPIETNPIEINSKDAPRTIPVCKSPSTSPASVLKISGLPIFCRPINLESITATTPTKPNKMAFNNIYFPPLLTKIYIFNT